MKKSLIFFCGFITVLFVFFDSAGATMLRTTFRGEVIEDTFRPHPLEIGRSVSISWVWDDASTEYTLYGSDGDPNVFDISGLSGTWTHASDAILTVGPYLSGFVQVPDIHGWSMVFTNADAAASGAGMTHHFTWAERLGESHLEISAFISLTSSGVALNFDISTPDWHLQNFENITITHEEIGEARVPEPATAVLLCLGLLCTAGIGRKP